MARRAPDPRFADRLFDQAVELGVPISQVAKHTYEFDMNSKRIEFKPAGGATIRLTSYDEDGSKFGTVVRTIQYVEELLQRCARGAQ